MKASKILLLFNKPNQAVGKYTILTDGYASVGIFKASDVAPKTLLRTIFSNVYHTAGEYTMYWDGLDDFGNNIIASNDYIGVVLDSQTAASWSTVGNTSTLNHGPTKYHGYSSFTKLCFSGNEGYYGRYYDEGRSCKGNYFNRSIDIQVSHDILPSETDPNAGNVGNDTNLSTEYICTDGTNIYFGGIDPGATVSNYGSVSGSWVYGVKVSDKSNLAWSSGTSIKAGSGATYPNAIDIVIDSPTDLITGMCTNGTYLWVAHGATNKIYVYSCSTGAATAASPITFTNPRELVYDASNGGRVWFIQGAGGIVKGVIGANGNITSGALTISDFPSNKMTLAVNNAGTAELAVVVGGTTEQVWFWNISASSPSGTNTGKLGQVGGYQSISLVSNDRFQFSGTDTELKKPFICYDASSNLYVFDAGGERIQIFDSSRVYSDTIQVMATSYTASVDMTDATRVMLKYLEFEIDPATAAWTYKRNFRAQITPNFYLGQGYGAFKFVSTLSNGKTYGCLDDYSALPSHQYLTIFEMTDTTLRNTSIRVNTSGFFEGFLDDEFTWWYLDPVNNTVGNTISVKKNMVTSFPSNNPTYGGASTVVTLDPLASGDILLNTAGGFIAGVTGDYVYINSGSVSGTATSRVQAYNINTGALVVSTALPTTNEDNLPFVGYNGWFPPPHRFDIGNGTVNGATQGQTTGDCMLVKYYGEFWKDVQTNYHNIIYKNGLPLTQFGTNRLQSQAIEVSGVESAGNGFGCRFTQYDPDTIVLFHCDESTAAAGHLWLITGLSTIRLQNVTVIPPSTQPLPGVDLMSSVTFNSVLTTTGNITVSHAEGSGFLSQSGTKHWDSYDPDVAVYLSSGSASNGDSKGVKLGITPNPVLTSYYISGEVQLFGFGADANITPTSVLRLLDSGNKVIAQIGMGNVIVTNDFEVTCNSTVILDGVVGVDNDLHINYIQQWQPFLIQVDQTSVTITYGNEAPVSTTLFDPTALWNEPTNIETLVKRISVGIGIRGLAMKTVRFVEDLTPIPSVILSAQTISSTEIEVTFSKFMSTVTTTGWSFDNGSALTLLSVSGADDVWTFVVQEIMTPSDTITGDYIRPPGITEDVDSIFLVDDSFSIDNNILGSGIRPITFDHTKVAANETNFTVTIAGTYSYLKTIANGGNVTSSDGYDIGFYADSGLVTKLKWHMQQYDPTTGYMAAKVKVPSLDSSTNTVIYMNYGNASITTDQSDSANSIDSHYVLVDYLPDGTTLTPTDITSNGNNATNHGAAPITGLFGQGANIVPSDYLDYGSDSSLNLTGEFCFDMMLNLNNFPISDYGTIFSKSAGGGNEAFAIRIDSSTNLTLFGYVGGFSGRLANWTIAGWTTGVDHIIHGEYDGTDWNLYFDGSQVATASEGSGAPSSTGILTIGAVEDGSRNLDAKVYEVRLADIGRGANWVETDTNARLNYTTFYTIGTVI